MSRALRIIHKTLTRVNQARRRVPAGDLFWLAGAGLVAGGAALAGEAFYKVFSQELFPTMLRGTAQGFTFGFARIVVGVWSFFVPRLSNHGVGTLAALLTLFLIISGGVGFFFMPDTSGKSLEQIEAERA